MRRLTLFFFLFASVALAQELPDAPKPHTVDRQFLVTIGTLAAAKTADAISTERFLARGCVELNPMLGPHPSMGELAAHATAYFAAETAVAYLLKKTFRRVPVLRRAWMIEPVFQTAQHIRFTVANEGLVCQ